MRIASARHTLGNALPDLWTEVAMTYMEIHYWRPSRRTRQCAAADCTAREAVRTTAILINGRQPISLCGTHWRAYARRLPEYDQERLTVGEPETTRTNSGQRFQ